jgi:hypothetical protein
MWMSEYEIEEMLRFTAIHELPVARRGAEVLARLMGWTNTVSDGWPYWAKPSRSAAKLMTLLDTTYRAHYRGGHGDISEEDLKKAITPIKAFLTRQDVDPEDKVRIVG